MSRAQVAEAQARIDREVYSAAELEALTGIPESTWHYFAFAGKGPASLQNWSPSGLEPSCSHELVGVDGSARAVSRCAYPRR